MNVFVALVNRTTLVLTTDNISLLIRAADLSNFGIFAYLPTGNHLYIFNILAGNDSLIT